MFVSLESQQIYTEQTLPPHMTNKAVPFYLYHRYVIQQILGTGAYGIVCSAVDKQHQLAKPVSVAVKKMYYYFLAYLFRFIPSDARIAFRLLREIKIMNHFRMHPHDGLVLLHNIIKPTSYPDFVNKNEICIVMDLADMSMARCIHQMKIQFNRRQLQALMHQLLTATKYLHSAHVVHRDIVIYILVTHCLLFF